MGEGRMEVPYVQHARMDGGSGGRTTERSDQWLLHPRSLIPGLSVKLVTTPAGDGSPAGLHSHEFHQIFVVLAGRMQIEVEGVHSVAGPNGLVVFPAGKEHRNWNEGPDATSHLVFNIHRPAAT